jgi:hypothetical protein
MKKFVFALVPFLVAGTALANEASKAKTHATATAKSHATVSAEIVSADASGKQITYKTDDGQEKTLAVEGKAAASLSAVKPGEKVKLTFRDSAAGEHEAVTSIRAAHYGKTSGKSKTTSTSKTSH